MKKIYCVHRYRFCHNFYQLFKNKFLFLQNIYFLGTFFNFFNVLLFNFKYVSFLTSDFYFYKDYIVPSNNFYIPLFINTVSIDKKNNLVIVNIIQILHI